MHLLFFYFSPFSFFFYLFIFVGDPEWKRYEFCYYEGSSWKKISGWNIREITSLQESIDHFLSKEYVWHKITCQFEHLVHCVIARGSCKSAKGIVNKAAAASASGSESSRAQNRG